VAITRSPELQPGEELAGYRVESVAGRGGMGVVYRALDLRLKRPVALKLLTPQLAADPRFRDRFLRESELAASLDHSNVVPVYSAGEADGRLYIVMRFVEGTDFGALLARESPLDAPRAIRLVAQVAAALDSGHARGLVHRDVKPANVLIAREADSEHCYLSDFGLSRVSDDDGQSHGSLSGTVAYTAPEQVTGEPVDGRADLYSLACVLYECLAGDPPFKAERRTAVLFAHVHEDVPALTAYPALDPVLRKALAKSPGGRYPSCRDFVESARAALVEQAAHRAAASRTDLRAAEAELAENVAGLQLPAAVLDPDVCPFKGLESFEADDASVFFGRERLVAELVAHIAGASLAGIVGASGSGKSSVLRAGLLPALAAGVLPDSETWRQTVIRPGGQPLAELQRAVAGNPRVLAVDQLEEVFTHCRDEDER
jgi:protein kinase-like protein/conflict system STAND superfamily ATPase